MRVLIAALFVTTLSLVPRASAADAPPSPPAGWVLVWQDEFDKPQVDPSKWNVEDWPSGRNNELQYYTPEDVSIKDGCLRLGAQKREFKGRTMTAGAVNSRGRFAQTYGRFEVRARLPKTQGIWPAHWMLAEEGGWPPEIDIMEMLGHKPAEIHMTNHWRDDAKKHKQAGKMFKLDADSSLDFHTYAVEWEPDAIRWFIDGVQRFEVKEAVPAKPFYLLLNTAVGGNWPKNPDATTIFPQYHDIDYVRVYRRAAHPAQPTVRFINPTAHNPHANFASPLVARKTPVKVGAEITLAASACDADPKATIEYLDGTTVIGEAAAAPYTVAWRPAKPGAYQVTARIKGSAISSPPIKVDVAP